MTIQCGITLMRNHYMRRYDRDFPASDDNIMDVLEHYDMPPVRLMNEDQIEFMVGELHSITLMLARLDKLNASNRHKRKVTGAG